MPLRVNSLVCCCLLVFFVPVLHAAEPSAVYDWGQMLAPKSSEQSVPPSSSAPSTSVPQITLPPTVLQAPGNAPVLPTAMTPQQPVPIAQPYPQTSDYSANLASDVFGAQLFTGAFARQSSSQFNPDYVIMVGDTIQIRLWGGVEFDRTLTVDPKGNIFMPVVGPIRVLGARNQDLQVVVESAIHRVFRSKVYCYASLAAAQPVRIFVGGFVRRPGLYNGTSMDSLLNYIDQAGGIDPDRGSFLAVQVKRGGQVRTTVNLYDFLLAGNLPMVQLADGDVLFVQPRQNVVKVSGLAQNAKRFEFSGAELSLTEIVRYAKPKGEATHVRVTRNTGPVKSTDYYPLSGIQKVRLTNGDDVEFTADKKPGTITVRVEGEHLSPQEYVLPYGTNFGEIMQKIQLTQYSEPESLQLFRQSVRDRQKQMLQTSLRSLETSVLTARSASGEEARLRTDEAALVLKWIERAKQVEPVGQVVITSTQRRNELLLENGDIIRVPTRDGLVLINGEVLFPNAIAFDPSLKVRDYVALAGGFTQNANSSRIIIAHVDGSFNDDSSGGDRLKPGDQILVLPKVDSKSRMFFKDIVQIMFQIAMTAKVALGW